MKKLILFIIILLMCFLGYFLFKQKESQKHNQWLEGQYYKENPEIYFESNNEKVMDPDIECNKKEILTLLKSSRYFMENNIEILDEISCTNEAAIAGTKTKGGVICGGEIRYDLLTKEVTGDLYHCENEVQYQQ